MSGQESDHLRPLCPAHYERMVISPARLESIVLPTTWDARDWYDCPIDKCPQHYSPICGYFIVESNDEHFQATGSSALRISRNPTQVICHEHKDVMLLESFDPNTGVENFRCPRETCQNAMKAKAGGAP